jgi:fatty acid desaturase
VKSPGRYAHDAADDFKEAAMNALEVPTDQTPGDNDRVSGMALLFLFSLATLLVVIAVWALGVLGGWWMLGVAMVIHLGMTTAVMFGLARALSDGPSPDQPDHSPSVHRTPVRGHAVMTS